MILKQQLEEEDDEFAEEDAVAVEAEALEAAATVAAALNAANAAADVGLMDAAEIAATTVDLVKPQPLTRRHRSGSLDIYDMEMKNRIGRQGSAALSNRRKYQLFNNTADNLAELAMADAAYAYAANRRRSGSMTQANDRSCSRLSALTMPHSRMSDKGKMVPSTSSASLYAGRLASSSRSMVNDQRLLRTASDLFLSNFD